MKLNLKTFSIFSLVGLFLVSTFVCCCVTSIAKAEEHKPSCHQTQQKADSSGHNSNECDCDQSIAIIQGEELLSPSFNLIAFLRIDHQTVDIKPIAFKARAYQAPPRYNDTIPLYIKYSILRI